MPQKKEGGTHFYVRAFVDFEHHEELGNISTKLQLVVTTRLAKNESLFIHIRECINKDLDIRLK